MFLLACFSVDLPIYEEVGFKQVYHESLKSVAFATESFDDVVPYVKQWSINFVSYLSDQKSQYFPTHEISSKQFFNLTVSPPQEEFVFNRHIGTDCIYEVEEETEMMEVEESDEEMEVDEVMMDPVPEAQSEVVTDGPEIQLSSETLSSLSSQSINTICLAGVSLVILAAASAVSYVVQSRAVFRKATRRKVDTTK
ncbi:hypothetical protein Tco_1169900, partial [Tanacetum coccineum]